MEKVNLDMLRSHGISADEYIFLKLLKEQRIQSLQDCYELFKIREDVLIKKGYLKRLKKDSEAPYVYERFDIRKRFEVDFYGDAGSMWAELVSTYPHKVPSPGGGTRVLHAQDPDALSNVKLKKKYLKAINEDHEQHRKVINALKRELSEKRSNLGYLKNLSTWINNFSWEEYDYHDNKSVDYTPEPTPTVNYGQELK